MSLTAKLIEGDRVTKVRVTGEPKNMVPNNNHLTVMRLTRPDLGIDDVIVTDGDQVTAREVRFAKEFPIVVMSRRSPGDAARIEFATEDRRSNRKTR